MQENLTPKPPQEQSTIALSEKHLEDWLCSDEMIREGFWTRVVGRQIRLPSGICDMIVIRQAAMSYNAPPILSLTVVEAKKGDLTSEALAQCLRYMRDLKSIFYEIRYPFSKDDEHLYDDYHDHTIVDQVLGRPFEISGMLVGNSMKDNNLRPACFAADVEAWGYTYKDGVYDIDWIDTDGGSYNNTQDYIEAGFSEIGQAIHEVLQSRLNAQRTRNGGEA